MRIGFAAPLTVAELVPWLDVEPGAPLPVGLGGTNTTILLRALLEAGHDISAVTLDPGLTSPVELRGEQLTLHIGPYRPRHRARDYFRDERAFVRSALLHERPDVVSAHWAYEFALGSLATGLPTVVSLHDWAPTIVRLMGVTVAPYYLVRLAMQTQVLLRSEALTANSPVIAAKAARWVRRPVDVLPNSFDQRVFTATERQPSESDHPTVLAASNGFNRLKNTATLMKAIARARDDIPGVRLHLAGDDHGPNGPAEMWARKHGFDRGVEFLGPVPHDELLKTMGTADLFVHPSRYESFGNVLVEAMAQGTPVIGGNRSGAVPWVLDGGRAGVLTDVRRPDVLADAIVSMLIDHETWTQFSRSGPTISEQRFSSRVIARDYADILAAHLAADSPRPGRRHHG